MDNYCNRDEERLVQLIKDYGSISASELGTYLQTGSSTVRAMISHLRRDHFKPICSTSQQGFFWPKAPEDVERTIKHIESRRKVMAEVIDGLRLGAAGEFGPPMLFDLEEYLALEREGV